VASAETPEDALVAEGIRLRREHRDVEALERFRRAYQTNPAARTRAQIALAEQALGLWVQAELDLNGALASQDDAWIAGNADALRRAESTIQRHLGSLAIDVNVTPAELWVNGVRTADLPSSPVRVVAGICYAEVRAPGYQTVRRTLDVPAAGTLTEHFELAPIPELSTPPKPEPKVPAPSIAAPPVATDTRRLFAWGAVGAASAFLGGAVVAQIVREQSAQRYNDHPSCGRVNDQVCNVYQGQADAAQTIATIGYVASGALGIAAGVLFLTAPRATPRSNVATLWFDVDASSVRAGIVVIPGADSR
jgi:hypothetical protein